MRTCKKFIILILLSVLVIIFLPFIYFCLGYFTGLLIKFTFGTTFIKGLSLIGITITKANIPLFCGIIGIIAGFLRNPEITTKN